MFTPIPPFAGFTNFTPTLPKFYWDVYDKEQMIKHLTHLVHKCCKYAEYMGEEVNEYATVLNGLVEQFEQFKESGFDDYYYEQIHQWVIDNMPEIIGMYVRMVFFGITTDGYFVAYVPRGNGWDDIIFDTIMDYNSDNYGHLVLEYEVENPEHSVNQP